MSYERSPRAVCSTTIGTRLRFWMGSMAMRVILRVWGLNYDSSESGLTIAGPDRIVSGTGRAHHFVEAQVLSGGLGVFSHPLGHLIFHHSVLQPGHELGIAVVEFNDLFRLLI